MENCDARGNGFFKKKFEDNECAIRLSEAVSMNKIMKHIDVKYRILNEMVRKNIIKFTYYVCSADQKADIYTKSSNSKSYTYLKKLIGVF